MSLEPMARHGSFFDLYIETQLVPTLHKGDVVILDNLATHRSPKAAAILKDIGAWFRCSGKTVHWTLFFTLQPAAILPRPQPHRNGIRQAQGPDQKGRCPNL
jgi:hypothetical protein